MRGSTVFCIFVSIFISTVSERLVSASIADNNVDDIEQDSICETTACIHEASFILENMNSSADPCENFYEFACGQFVQKTIIPDDKAEVGLFGTTNDKINQQLRLQISAEIEEDDQPAIKTLKSYYHTCMDTDQVKKNRENDLQEILSQLGGCPILEGSEWDEKDFDWKKSVYKANKMGYDTNFLINMQIGYDLQNSSRHIISLDQALIDLPREFLISDENNDMLQVYTKLVVDFFELLGVDRKQAEKEVNDVIDFEIKLAKISLSKEDQRELYLLNNRMTLHQLEANYAGIPWTEYLNKILAPHARLYENEEVRVIVPTFLKQLPGLIKNTPNRVLANYIGLQIILQSIDYMGTDNFNIMTEAYKAFSGTQEQMPRWKKCLELTSNHFSVALSGLYVKHYFVQNSKTDAIHLTRNLRDSLSHLIKQANWMDDATKLAAIDKLQSVVAYVGYPDELENNEKINKLYENITLDPTSFLRSEMNLNQFEKKIAYSKLRKPTDVLTWVVHSDIAEANAFYFPNINSFDLPAGILQGHFYNIDRPNYMNYGAIGSIVGHELSHAFDDEGSQYDKNGNVVNWWKDETRKKYMNKVRCIIEQYGNYTVKEINLMMNGINSQGENIADNVGLKAARYAYNKWTKKHGKEPRLPGLPYTSQQMFWISYANNWCEKSRPETLRLNIVGDSHSSAEARVIGVLSNSNQFAKDFNCPLGSPMNSVKKCKIW